MLYEWDEHKNRRNLEKHRISFEDAVEILESSKKLVCISQDKGSDDNLYIAVGVLNGKHYSVIYTMRADAVRIISARRSRDDEKRDYGALHD